MAKNDIEDMLDHLKKIKSGGDMNRVKTDQIETLEMELRFLSTFIKFHHVFLPDSLAHVAKKAEAIREMHHSVFGGTTVENKTNLNVERLVSQMLQFIEGKTSPMCNFVLNGTDLSEYMDCLDKNLNDAPRYLVRSDPFLTREIKVLQKTDKYLRQLKGIQKKIRFVRYLYGTKINGHVDHEKLEGLETRIQFIADGVGQFCLALWMTEIDGDDTVDIENKPPYLLSLIVLLEREMQKLFVGELKASKVTGPRIFKDRKSLKGSLHLLHSSVVYLRNKKLPTNVSASNIEGMIEFLLVLLSNGPNYILNGNMLNEVFEKVGVLVDDITFVVQKLLANFVIKEKIIEIDLATIKIQGKIDDLKAQIEEWSNKSLKFSLSHQFPTVGGLSFLISLLRKLNAMLKSESSLDLMMKPHIGILEKDLSSLTSIFKHAAEVHHEHESTLEDLQRHTINLAYEAEVAIDSILVRYNAFSNLFCSLPSIIKEIKHINVKVTEMWSKNLALKPCSVVKPSKRHESTQHNNISMNAEEIVGFENETENIIRHLIGGKNELDVFPIVGMGGQGKTTCARKLYNNGKIVSHFDVRAWCVISQTYSRRELLQIIFSQVVGSKNIVEEDSVLADMLRKGLIGKRYLIVLDDMWDGKAWDDLRFSFQECNKGCRIIVTTRLEEVGKQVKHHTNPYFLPFLTTKESCELLLKKVFQNEGFPHELHDVSLAVAKRCKGLPLAVVLVAGILKRKKMEVSWWHEVENALFTYLAKSDQDYSLATMQLSYDNLPDHIRPCLLYMGMCPEDNIIKVYDLINLWVAEGFVQDVESRSLEETAKGYLMDLISRNLVMVSGRGDNGKVKYCKLHDIVLHFCLEKSREEKFMSVVKGYYSQFNPLDWKENRVSFHNSDEIWGFPLQGSKTHKPFHYLRSVLTYRYVSCNSWNPFRHISKLRLLKVLDLRFIPVDYLSSTILHPLIHLKYLALHTRRLDLEPEFYMLCHLETLIVSNIYANAVSLPATFWKMVKLRHVEMWCYPGQFEGYLKLENLRILNSVNLSLNDTDCVDALSQRCPNLEVLGICLDEDDDAPEESSYNLKLEDFTQLQILHLMIWGQIMEFRLPLNLKELLLDMPWITASVVSMIAELPSLEYLYLRNSEFEEEEWCLGDITFHKLKFLQLDSLPISRWDALEESFPQLETLNLHGLSILKEIPLSFAYIQTLKHIELISCDEAVVASAEKIKDEIEAIEGSADRLVIKVDRW